jgi:hypothetical protein
MKEIEIEIKKKGSIYIYTLFVFKYQSILLSREELFCWKATY